MVERVPLDITEQNLENPKPIPFIFRRKQSPEHRNYKHKTHESKHSS